MTLALCLLLAFCKNGILFLPWEKNGLAKTGAARLIPPALPMKVIECIFYQDNVCNV